MADIKTMRSWLKLSKLKPRSIPHKRLLLFPTSFEQTLWLERESLKLFISSWLFGEGFRVNPDPDHDVKLTLSWHCLSPGTGAQDLSPQRVTGIWNGQICFQSLNKTSERFSHLFALSDSLVGVVSPVSRHAGSLIILSTQLLSVTATDILPAPALLH